jgi:hypothetical protein
MEDCEDRCNSSLPLSRPEPEPRTVVLRRAMECIADAQSSVGCNSELAAILGRVAVSMGAVDSGAEWEQW